MIIRVFSVEIIPEFKREFEAKFILLSLRHVQDSEGCIGAEIYKPSSVNPNKYLMLSRWENENALKKFAGENWESAVIPDEMQKFARSYHVDHFEGWS